MLPTLVRLNVFSVGLRPTYPQSGAQILIANIQDTRQMFASMNLSKTIPVGNSDAEAWFNTQVLGAIDYGVRHLMYPDRRMLMRDVAGQRPPMVLKHLDRRSRHVDYGVL